MHITETKWWNDVCHGVFGPRNGGARIIIDAEDASTGVGKTGLAVYVAKLLAKAFDYELQNEDLTLSGQAYRQRWREHPDADQPSVLILDELSGAGAGDGRRSMSTENVNLGRSWQLMRKKRIVTITTLPHWSDADVRLQRFADYRLWCLREPIGYFRPYKVGSTFDDGNVTTEAYDDVSRIRFPNLDEHNDEHYQYLAGEKDELLQSEFFDADALEDDESDDQLDPEEARRDEKKETAQRMREAGLTTHKIADHVGRSQSWVSIHTESPENAG